MLGEYGLEPVCYARNVEISGTILFQPGELLVFAAPGLGVVLALGSPVEARIRAREPQWRAQSHRSNVFAEARSSHQLVYRNEMRRPHPHLTGNVQRSYRGADHHFPLPPFNGYSNALGTCGSHNYDSNNAGARQIQVYGGGPQGDVSIFLSIRAPRAAWNLYGYWNHPLQQSCLPGKRSKERPSAYLIPLQSGSPRYIQVSCARYFGRSCSMASLASNLQRMVLL